MRRVLLLLAVFAAGCSRSQMVDRAMSSAPRPAAPAPPAPRRSPYQLLAGDMHCHVLPPDSETHVTRDLATTVALAKQEKLDFVVLTPHVPARFFADAEKRRWVVETQRALRERVSAWGSDVVLVPGMEYTDHRYGHVGVAFADLDAVLAETPLGASPEKFFERWVARGGVLTINHPVLKPLPGAPFAILRADLSWRGFERGRSVPPEIAWVTTHAQSIETFNLSVTHLRDQFIVGDVERSLREASSLTDRASRDQHRKIAAVGGSDSHGDYLRGTTWVLATARTPDGIRDAIANARTCVRGPEACSFEARAAASSDRWQPVGTAFLAEGAIEVRAFGGPVRILVNGAIAARAQDGEVVRVPVSDGCTLVRAVVGPSWSSPIYVNCLWAR